MCVERGVVTRGAQWCGHSYSNKFEGIHSARMCENAHFRPKSRFIA